MTVDNLGLNYSSQWDIDQLVQQGTKVITAANGLNTYSIVNHNLGVVPVCWLTYLLSGKSYWNIAGAPGESLTPTNSPGLNSTLNVAVAALPTTSALSVQINNFTGGNVTLTLNYYIDSDEVTH